MNILWLDVETTGLDLEKDKVIEAAFVVQNNNTVLMQGSFIIKDLDDTVDELVAMMAPYVKTMHMNSGLIDDMRSEVDKGNTITPHEFDMLLLGGVCTKDLKTVFLGGRSVHFDRSHLLKIAPNFMAELGHRHMDCTSIRAFLELVGIDVPTVEPETPHRALDDIIADIQWLANAIQATKKD